MALEPYARRWDMLPGALPLPGTLLATVAGRWAMLPGTLGLPAAPAPVPYARLATFPHTGICHAVQWVLAGDETGAPWARPDLPLKSVQVYGAFGAGTVTIEAAAHATSPQYAGLKDVHGNPMSGIADTYLETAQTNAALVRPVAAGVTSVTIVCVAAGPRTSGG